MAGSLLDATRMDDPAAPTVSSPRPSLDAGAGNYYGVGILPPDDIGAAVDRYRARYDGEFYPRTVPHVTVKQTFQLIGPEEALLEHVAGVCRGTEPFPLGLVGVGDFGHGGSHVVYLAVLHTPELMGFQHRLVRAVADLAGHSPLYSLDYELSRYLPHLTLGQRLTPERLEAVRAELAAEQYRPAYCFPTTHISVARRDPDLVWRRPYLVELGTGTILANPFPEQPPWPR